MDTIPPAAGLLTYNSPGYLAGIAPELTRFCQTRGILLRPLGNTIYVMPPYCIGDEDLDAIYAAIAEACDWPKLG